MLWSTHCRPAAILKILLFWSPFVRGWFPERAPHWLCQWKAEPRDSVLVALAAGPAHSVPSTAAAPPRESPAHRGSGIFPRIRPSPLWAPAAQLDGNVLIQCNREREF